MARKKGVSQPVSKKDKEYWEAKKRLEKAQAKYLGTFNNESNYKKGKNASKGKVSIRTERGKRWRDWRESDGNKYPVTGSVVEKNSENNSK